MLVSIILKQILIIILIVLGVTSCSEKVNIKVEDGVYLMNNNRTGIQVDFMNCSEPDCNTYVDSTPYLELSKLRFEIDQNHKFLDIDWFLMKTEFPPVRMGDFEPKHNFNGISYFVLVLDGQAINYEPVIDSMIDVQFVVALEDWKREDIEYLEKKLKK